MLSSGEPEVGRCGFEPQGLPPGCLGIVAPRQALGALGVPEGRPEEKDEHVSNGVQGRKNSSPKEGVTGPNERGRNSEFSHAEALLPDRPRSSG